MSVGVLTLIGPEPIHAEDDLHENLFWGSHFVERIRLPIKTTYKKRLYFLPVRCDEFKLERVPLIAEQVRADAICLKKAN